MISCAAYRLNHAAFVAMVVFTALAGPRRSPVSLLARTDMGLHATCVARFSPPSRRCTVCVFSEPSRHIDGAKGLARAVMQSLEGIKVLEKHPNGGRRITSKGQQDLDRIATQVLDRSA